MTKQLRQFALFILVIGITTSLVYHAVNRNRITLQKAHEHVSKDRYSEAAPLYEKLVTAGVQSKDVYEGLLACQNALKNPEKARATLQALIQKNPESDPARLSYLAATALGMGQQDIAAQQYRKVLLIRPTDRPARLGLARALARAGLYEDAVKEYRILLGEIR
jgi:tetratricopeptide (TPR) repeat protein